MERETGFEPATSSLGKGTSIENKEHRVLVVFAVAALDLRPDPETGRHCVVGVRA